MDHAFSTNQKGGAFAQEAAYADMSAFINSSFYDPSFAPALGDGAIGDFTFSLPSDSALASPLGLSPSESPFTPPLAFRETSLYTTADVGSLFGAAPGGTLGMSGFDTLGLNVEQAVHAATVLHTSQATFPSPDAGTPELVVSPMMTRLPSPTLTVKAEPVEARIPAASKGSRSFTGTRNTTIPAIDMNAPTLPKSYLLPSATSRKRAPPAVTSQLTKSKRARVSATPLADNEEATLKVDEVDDDLLKAIEEKRRTNTLAARRSRQRKQEHIAGLQGEVDRLTELLGQYREACAANGVVVEE